MELAFAGLHLERQTDLLAVRARLTVGSHGHINPAGLGFAGLAATGWAAYILLTQRIGDRFTGTKDSHSPSPAPQQRCPASRRPPATGPTLGILPAAAGLALLLPVLPYAFEMLALGQMTPTAFGTLMALEPAIGVLLGPLVLHQNPRPPSSPASCSSSSPAPPHNATPNAAHRPPDTSAPTPNSTSSASPWFVPSAGLAFVRVQRDRSSFVVMAPAMPD